MRIKFSGNYDSSFTFFPKSGEVQKKRSLPQFGTIFGSNWWGLFVLKGTFSSDHPALNSPWGYTQYLDGGTLNLDGGTPTLDGGDASPLQFKYRYWIYGTV